MYLLDGLMILRNRGYDSAGIATLGAIGESGASGGVGGESTGDGESQLFVSLCLAL